MQKNCTYKYDVVFSFAGAQRSYVEKVKEALKQYDVSVFYDNDNSVDLWGRNLYRFLDMLYSQEARYCVMFISKEYKKRPWTIHESQSAQERMFHQYDADGFQEYILPVRFDDSQISGIRSTTGCMDARELTPEELAHCIACKLGKDNDKLQSLDVYTIFEKLVVLLKRNIEGNSNFALEQEEQYAQIIRKGSDPVLSIRLSEQYIMIEPKDAVSGVSSTITIFCSSKNREKPIKVINFSDYLFQVPESDVTLENLLQLFKYEFAKILEVSNDTISR
jgi:hypothetical protein